MIGYDAPNISMELLFDFGRDEVGSVLGGKDHVQQNARKGGSHNRPSMLLMQLLCKAFGLEDVWACIADRGRRYALPPATLFQAFGLVRSLGLGTVEQMSTSLSPYF